MGRKCKPEFEFCNCYSGIEEVGGLSSHACGGGCEAHWSKKDYTSPRRLKFPGKESGTLGYKLSAFSIESCFLLSHREIMFVFSAPGSRTDYYKKKCTAASSSPKV